ncbi:hypothetical protein [Dokdonella sp.]|uniref:hypothetical protein n=1 Tax=Dokdonella sp. TaxID=2291710 RepID=UPI0031C84E40|nr:response regulator [Dokdonella sp.]
MNTLSNALLATLLAGTCAAWSSPAGACGEVMYRMGSALRYQAWITRHPARILLFGTAASAEAKGLDRAGLQRSLEKAGHQVSVAADGAALDASLAAQAFDIVITDADHLAVVQRALAAAAGGPSLIPVVTRGDLEATRRQYPEAVAASGGINRFLKTIERTMEARGS